MFAVAQIGVSPTVAAAIIATLITVGIGGLVAAVRYVFDVQLVTEPEVDRRVVDAVESLQEQDEEIAKTLDEHGDKLDRLEELVLGGEYQISDGMLELIELNAEDIDDHEGRITDVERIQLKIRRRQAEDDVDRPERGPGNNTEGAE